MAKKPAAAAAETELLAAARNAVAEYRAANPRRPLPEAMGRLAAIVAERDTPAEAPPDSES